MGSVFFVSASRDPPEKNMAGRSPKNIEVYCWRDHQMDDEDVPASDV